MTLRELRNQIKRQDIPDLWWIAIDGKVQDGRIRLVDLQIRHGRLVNRRVQLLNAHRTGEDNWISIELAPKLNLEKTLGNTFSPIPASVDRRLKRGEHATTRQRSARKVSVFLAQKERELLEREAELKDFARELSQRELEVKKGEMIIEERMLAQARKETHLLRRAKLAELAHSNRMLKPS